MAMTLEQAIAKAERQRAATLAEMDRLSQLLSVSMGDAHFCFNRVDDPELWHAMADLMDLLANRAETMMAIDLPAEISKLEGEHLQ